MEVKAQKAIEEEAVTLHPKECVDVTSLVSEITPTLQQQFPLDSPQYIFWEQQQHYNALKEKRQMKWHPLLIRLALNLKYLLLCTMNKPSMITPIGSDHTLVLNTSLWSISRRCWKLSYHQTFQG